MRSVMKSRIVRALAPRARIARVFVAVALAGAFTSSCDVHGISGPGSLVNLVVRAVSDTRERWLVDT